MMPALQQLRLGAGERPDEIVHECWQRPGGTPLVRRLTFPTVHVVNWLRHGEVRLPFEPCNDLLGQQLTTLVSE